MTYSEAVDYLYNSRPPFHIVGADAYKPGLDATLRLMAHVGNPHQDLRAVHIAGTNGKGSTSHLIAAVLQSAGLRVGLYTSPHLVDLRERIRINGVPVAEDKVVAFIEQNRDYLDTLQPSFFETMTAMAFAIFVEEQVDIAVIETGLGGRLDSTNVLTPLLSVITNIGLDHTEFLGNTLPEIAREKAGIIKPGVPCVIGESHPLTDPVFIERARECHILGEGLETTDCRIWFADQCGYLRRCRLREAPECELHGIYQEHNMQTAYVALRALNSQLSTINCRLSTPAIAAGFAHVCSLTGLHGRWETLCEHPLTICDTGHNSHGIQYVAKQLSQLTNPHIWIVFGMVNDKDTDVVMRLLPQSPISNIQSQISNVQSPISNIQSPISNIPLQKGVGGCPQYHYIFTRPDTKRARSAQEMLSMWGKEGAIAIEDPVEAIRYAQAHANADDAIFIGGSNYLVGSALQLFQ